METRAAHLVVGLFVLGIMGALVAFVVWLGQITLTDTAKRYLINFDGSVTGLSVGGTVRYSGVPVGSVESISIDPQSIETIAVVVAVDQATPILQGAVASLEMAGITGGTFVQITGGTSGAPPIAAAVPGRLPEIPSVRTGLQEIMTSLPQLLSEAREVIAAANELLSGDNRATITEILINIQTMTENFALNSGRFTEIVDQVSSIAGNIDALVLQLRGDIETISGTLENTLSAVNDQVGVVSEAVESLTRSFSATANQVTVLLRDIRPGLTDFSGEGLYQFTLMVAELRSLAQTLGRLTIEFERDPVQFIIGGSSGQGVIPER